VEKKENERGSGKGGSGDSRFDEEFSPASSELFRERRKVLKERKKKLWKKKEGRDGADKTWDLPNRRGFRGGKSSKKPLHARSPGRFVEVGGKKKGGRRKRGLEKEGVAKKNVTMKEKE